jgi:hypothetical protein
MIKTTAKEIGKKAITTEKKTPHSNTIDKKVRAYVFFCRTLICKKCATSNIISVRIHPIPQC